jgi:hypothetical protein
MIMNISTIIIAFLFLAGIALIITGFIYYPTGNDTQTWPKTIIPIGFVMAIIFGVVLMAINYKGAGYQIASSAIALKLTP